MAFFREISIVGLGLMGGSLAAACRKKFPSSKVIGISRSRQALTRAKNKKWVHEVSSEVTRVSQSDLVVLATPVNTFASVISQIAPITKKGLIFTDVGSVKGEVIHWFEERNFPNIEFVGAHPMVGSHERGIEFCRKDLYEGGLVFLTPAKETSPKSTRLVQSFWKKLSKKVVTINAEVHDEIVSQISHLPHAIAMCLMNSVSSQELGFSASGFRDTTRIAQGGGSIWGPIFLANRKALLKSLDQYEKVLEDFRSFLVAGNEKEMNSFIEKARKSRRQLELKF